MKSALNIIGVVLGLLGIPILISLRNYTKQHAGEPLEEHERAIYSRCIALTIAEVGSAILNLITLFL